MRVLALDTTRRDGSVALIAGNRVVGERRGDPLRTHAERLPGDITALLDELGVGLADVDLFAVASGPGSFTGLRIGIATMQGLAFVRRRQIVAVSALEALAHSAGCDRAAGTIVGAWMDAHRGEVFTGLYRLTSGAPFAPRRLSELQAPAVRDPARVLSDWEALVHDEPLLIAGDGATRYEAVIRSCRLSCEVGDHPDLAGPIGLMAVERAAAGEAVDPSAVRPLYVRRPDAEVDRERRSAVAAATGAARRDAS